MQRSGSGLVGKSKATQRDIPQLKQMSVSPLKISCMYIQTVELLDTQNNYLVLSEVMMNKYFKTYCY